jgi:6-phosphogluconolactonase (cycloisomerase 2 family)
MSRAAHQYRYDAVQGLLSHGQTHQKRQNGCNQAVSPCTLMNTHFTGHGKALQKNGRFAYTANAGSATISSYSVAHGGELALLDVAAASVAGGSAPTDMALSNNSRFL